MVWLRLVCVHRDRRECRSGGALRLSMLHHQTEASQHAEIRHVSLVSEMVCAEVYDLRALCRETWMSVHAAACKTYMTYLRERRELVGKSVLVGLDRW
jgi:hypothetical protein